MKTRMAWLWVAMNLSAPACQSDDDGDGSGYGGTGSIALDELNIATVTTALNSCLSDDGYLRTTIHLRGTQGGYSYQGLPLQCLASITDGCRDVFDCFGLSPRQREEECHTCQDNVAILCDPPFRWQCSRIDATCRSGTCVPRGREPCDANFRSVCDGEGRPNDCDDVIHKGPVCALFGLECDDGDEADAVCRGTGPACVVDDTFFYFDIAPVGQSCNGDMLTACVDGAMAELDCSLFGNGFSCQQVAGAYFCGSADECDPETYRENCQGNQIVFCNAGKIERVDCVQLGFLGCVDVGRARCEWRFTS